MLKNELLSELFTLKQAEHKLKSAKTIAKAIIMYVNIHVHVCECVCLYTVFV